MTPHTVSETSPTSTDEQQLQPTVDAGVTPENVAVSPEHLETPIAPPIENSPVRQPNTTDTIERRL